MSSDSCSALPWLQYRLDILRQTSVEDMDSCEAVGLQRASLKVVSALLMWAKERAICSALLCSAHDGTGLSCLLHVALEFDLRPVVLPPITNAMLVLYSTVDGGRTKKGQLLPCKRRQKPRGAGRKGKGIIYQCIEVPSLLPHTVHANGQSRCSSVTCMSV